MRITYIAAGAAGSYCGACARDVALCRGLIARGHDVLLVPLYTPLRSDLPMPRVERVFYGGINAWLQDRSGLFRKTPRFVDWIFDRPWLLNLVARAAIETRPEELGAMTVSVLRGAEGPQRKELEKLVAFLEEKAHMAREVEKNYYIQRNSLNYEKIIDRTYGVTRIVIFRRKHCCDARTGTKIPECQD